MANVQILAVGRALVQGARGVRGGAPSKDSVWGVAMVDKNLVKFFGRTGGVLRYKTESSKNKDAAMAMFQDKLTKPFKTNGGEPVVYSDVTATFNDVIPGLAEIVGKGFYKATFDRKVNTRATFDAKAAARKQAAKARKQASKAAPAAAEEQVAA
jgi:hypothetical protein